MADAAGNWDELAKGLGPTYERYSPHERQRHAELATAVVHPRQVVLQANPVGSDRWWLEIVAADRIGMLPVIKGLITSHEVDILGGDVFVLRFVRGTQRAGSGSAAPRRGLPAVTSLRPGSFADRSRGTFSKLLILLEVFAPRGSQAAFWEAIGQELAETVAVFTSQDFSAARKTFIDRCARACWKHHARHAPPDPSTSQRPVRIEVESTETGEAPRLRFRGRDARGFLFEFTNALAMLNVRIERLTIRTHDQEVDDTVWITDARGEAIRSEARLRELCSSTVLIVQFMRLLPRAPDPEQALAQFVELTGDLLSRPQSLEKLESEQVLLTLAHVLGFSRYLWDDLLRMQHEELFPIVCDLPALDNGRSKVELESELTTRLQAAPDIVTKVSVLNRFKDRELFRIDLRNITRRVDFRHFAEELTDLAEVTVAQACEISHWITSTRFGRPRVADHDCAWCVLGLGKLGGRELGYASDIELIFVYEGEGQTDAAKPLQNSDYFERFVADFRRTVTARREGIFEIDLRLRPYGKAGCSASTMAAFREFYRPGGGAEQFQRLALVKLRPIAGDHRLAAAVSQARDQFVYSDLPIDYNDIQYLRQLQQKELVPARQISAKHSAGGLVDIEYFVQSQQIEVGRRDRRVRVTSTRQAITQLALVGHLPQDVAGELLEAYGFLRRLINALRAVRGNAKDLTLPTGDPRAFDYLARRLQYESTDHLATEIEAKRQLVSGLWERLPA